MNSAEWNTPTVDTETGLIVLFHGGRDLEKNYLEMRGNDSKQFEHGVGVYLISDGSIAEKYAKGGNKLYKVTVRPGNAAFDVFIDRQIVQEFLNRNFSAKAMKGEFNAYLEKSFERFEGKIRAEYVFNLLLNFNMLKPSKTLAVREFLLGAGVDYFFSRNYGGSENQMLVVVNPKSIEKVEVLRPNWRDDLPPENSLKM